MKIEPISDEQLIESLREDILEQADQIGGLVSELERANGLIDRALTALRDYVNPSETDRFHLTDKERQWVERSALLADLIVLGKNRNLERRQREQAEQQLAGARAELTRLREPGPVGGGMLRRLLDKIRACDEQPDEEGLCACARAIGQNLRWLEQDAEEERKKARQAEQQLAESQAEAAALRKALIALRDRHLSNYPHRYHTGDGWMVSADRKMVDNALAAPSAAAERVQVDVVVREALEFYANRNRYNLNWSLSDVGDGRRYPQPSDINCDGGSRARTALAALDAATALDGGKSNG